VLPRHRVLLSCNGECAGLASIFFAHDVNRSTFLEVICNACRRSKTLTWKRFGSTWQNSYVSLSFSVVGLPLKPLHSYLPLSTSTHTTSYTETSNPRTSLSIQTATLFSAISASHVNLRATFLPMGASRTAVLAHLLSRPQRSFLKGITASKWIFGRSV
jgi:hypothetical protein